MLNLSAPSDCYIRCHTVALSWFRLLYISKHVKSKGIAHITCEASNYPLRRMMEMLMLQSFIAHCPVKFYVVRPKSCSPEWDGEEINSSSYDLVQRKGKDGWKLDGWIKQVWLKNRNLNPNIADQARTVLHIFWTKFLNFRHEGIKCLERKERCRWQLGKLLVYKCLGWTNRAVGTCNWSALWIPKEKNISSSTAFQGNYFNLPGDNINHIWLVIF